MEKFITATINNIGLDPYYALEDTPYGRVNRIYEVLEEGRVRAHCILRIEGNKIHLRHPIIRDQIIKTKIIDIKDLSKYLVIESR